MSIVFIADADDLVDLAGILATTGLVRSEDTTPPFLLDYIAGAFRVASPKILTYIRRGEVNDAALTAEEKSVALALYNAGDTYRLGRLYGDDGRETNWGAMMEDSFYIPILTRPAGNWTKTFDESYWFKPPAVGKGGRTRTLREFVDAHCFRFK